MKASKTSLITSAISNAVFGTKFTYRLKYLHNRGHFPNLKHPKDLSEHLISKLFSPEFLENAKYADKVEVRKYITEKGLDGILLKHYGVWDKPEDIDYDILPEKFILKANNGCGHHFICKDKNSFDFNLACRILNESIHNGETSPEPHYRVIKPKVFAEELIDTGTNELPTDYKFTCINGEICDVFVAVERATNAKYITLDLDWNVLPYTKSAYLPKEIPTKPRLLDEMARIAKILSADFEFVRVDLYEYKDQVYFSELTFSPWGALMYSYTNEALQLLGKKFNK